jgi:predicted alpha/beta-hydrolase family hydrolase
MQERAIDLDGHPGLLVRPRGAQALYVFAHGAGAGMRHPFMAGVAEQLAERAIATLRWEFPYMAAGKKRVDAAPVAEQAVREVWNAASKQFRDVPRFAGGKSFGGRMTSRAHAAELLADLRGIAFLGFPLHPAGAPAPEMERAEFISARAVERAEHLPQAAGPLLFVQGTRDDLADLTLLRPIVKALGKRATLHVMDGADHGFGDKRIPELARVIAVWMEAVLDR